jgi:hypothetical protein
MCRRFYHQTDAKTKFMEPITSIADLKNAIQILEFEKAIKEQELKEEVYHIYENLKPVNLIKHTLSEVASSPYLIDNILGATVGLASGYISKKIAVGRSHNLIRKIFGAVLQFGVTNIVAQNADTIKSVGQSMYQHFRNKKEVNSKN